MFVRGLSVSLLALGTVLGAGLANAEEADVTAWRLFVSDHADGKVRVIDALDGNVIGIFDMKGPGSLYRSGSGETVFSIQGAAGVVSALATGIDFQDHGDHADIDVEDAKLLGFAMEGSKPAHFVEYQGNIAQWFDGEATARFFTEEGMLDGRVEIRTVDVGAAHHGVAVPFQNHAVVTIPNPEDASKRPIGARIMGFDGKQVGDDAACPGLHGSASSGSLYALACETGLLMISQKNGVPEITHLPYAPSLPKGSSSTLIGGIGLQYFIGNYGPDRLLVVDPSEGAEGFMLVQLPTRRVHFVVDNVRPRFAYVFTEDGQLHKLDVLVGQIVKSVKVTEPYSMDGHWSDPRPRLAVAGDSVVVTDPLAGKLHMLSADGLEETGEVALEGKPFNIVAVGGSGAAHEEGAGSHGGHKH